MAGLARCTMRNLMTATGAIGHDDGIGIFAYRRQQAQFRHLHGDVVVIGVIAKAAGHAAAGAFDQFGLCARDQPQHLQDRRHRAEGLLVAMAMEQDGRGRRLEGQGKAPGLGLARQEFFQQQRL